eukprot:3149872-Pleurochrysis_carterae.AAC.1
MRALFDLFEWQTYTGSLVRAKAGAAGAAVVDPPVTGEATIVALVLGRDGRETRRFVALELADEPNQ